MRANSGKGVPALRELSEFGAAPDGVQNMLWLYMYPRLYEAHGRRERHVLRHDGAHARGRGAYRAKIGVHRFLVDDIAALPILLIIHDERHRGGGCEDGWVAGKRQQGLALPKTDIAESELHSAGGTMLRREGIFANTQKKRKRHDYQVCRSRLAGRGGWVITGSRR